MSLDLADRMWAGPNVGWVWANFRYMIESRPARVNGRPNRLREPSTGRYTGAAELILFWIAAAGGTTGTTDRWTSGEVGGMINILPTMSIVRWHHPDSG